MAATMPKVLFVYYSYSQQTRRVVDAMADIFRERGCDVRLALIEFTDPRYSGRFAKFPLQNAYRNIFGMVSPQMRGITGQIRVPDEVKEAGFDLVCICSPVWWFHPCMPIRSFLESDLASTVLEGRKFAAVIVCHRYWHDALRIVKHLATQRGGKILGETHFIAAGGPVNSMLSFLSYISTGKVVGRYIGMKIPPPNLQPSYLVQAQAFANEMVDLVGARSK